MNAEALRHVAIIMDGNGRWATARGLSRLKGHRRGKDSVREVVETAREIGIEVLTLYAFSTENFERPDDEVGMLMELFAKRLAGLASDQRILNNGVRVRVLGRTEMLPPDVLSAIRLVEAATSGFEDFCLNFCIAYGGRQEILDSFQSILEKVQRGELDRDDVDEKVLLRVLAKQPTAMQRLLPLLLPILQVT